MSPVPIAMLSLLVVYSLLFLYRLFRLTWLKGKLGEQVYFDEVLGIFGRDVWKLLSLPYVIIESIVNRRT